MLIEVGNQAAQLNQITPPNYLPPQHPYGLHLFPKVIGLSIDPEYKAWMSKEIEHFQQHLSDDLPCGLIHGDLFFDNLLLEDKSGRWVFKAIIDFEEACHYYSVFELGMAAIGICVDDGTSVNLNKVRALVEGYQQIRSLLPIETKAYNYLYDMPQLQPPTGCLTNTILENLMLTKQIIIGKWYK